MAIKKKGFTLIELLVALFCASIILASLSASIYFVARIAGNVSNDAAITYRVMSLKDYIIDNRIVTGEGFTLQGDDVYYQGEFLYADTGVSSIVFSENDDFYLSQITYTKSSGGLSLRFVVASKP